MIRDTGVDPNRISIIGYPKFDMAPRAAASRPAGDARRPVVLYNPHVSPHLSSWYRHGRKVLDWFAGQDEYDLIFAPHVMLFQRPYVLTIDRLRIDRVGVVAPNHWQAANIHIDLGGPRSTDMTYTTRADIYLGDASSQVYEFLLRPRPCVFINSHRVAWRDDVNFSHWRHGPVIDDVANLGDALLAARRDHEAVYRSIQQALFDYTFDLSAEPSARRAAAVIAELAGLTWTVRFERPRQRRRAGV
ncbi:hypothetical protein [Phenylobacterium immobile]|uniref:hypothetical protein n=1 Tax=Phenylobacterium immobile TaxID=21 RepID=UPI000A5D7B21|nr:hypothetical protein [Phenylobacterium immobile]